MDEVYCEYSGGGFYVSEVLMPQIESPLGERIWKCMDDTCPFHSKESRP